MRNSLTNLIIKSNNVGSSNKIIKNVGCDFFICTNCSSYWINRFNLNKI